MQCWRMCGRLTRRGKIRNEDVKGRMRVEREILIHVEDNRLSLYRHMRRVNGSRYRINRVTIYNAVGRRKRRRTRWWSVMGTTRLADGKQTILVGWKVQVTTAAAVLGNILLHVNTVIRYRQRKWFQLIISSVRRILKKYLPLEYLFLILQKASASSRRNQGRSNSELISFNFAVTPNHKLYFLASGATS